MRYFAGARAAAGVDSEVLALTGPVWTVQDAVDELARRHGPELEKVLAASSFLLDEIAVRNRSSQLRHGATLDVLPPFAGG